MKVYHYTPHFLLSPVSNHDQPLLHFKATGSYLNPSKINIDEISLHWAQFTTIF